MTPWQILTILVPIVLLPILTLEVEKNLEIMPQI